MKVTESTASSSVLATGHADGFGLRVERVPDQLGNAGDRAGRPGKPVKLIRIDLDDEALWHRAIVREGPWPDPLKSVRPV